MNFAICLTVPTKMSRETVLSILINNIDCSDSVRSLRPAPLSYLCVRVRILRVLKIVCCRTIKPDCRRRLLRSRFLTDSAACVLQSTTNLQANPTAKRRHKNRE